MIQVGQKVYIVPDDSRQVPYYATVTKIGHKYITVDGGYYNHFTINSHRSVDDYNGWNPRLTLYENKEVYEKLQIKNAERKDILDKINSLLQNASLDRLKCVHDMLKL